MSNHNPIPLTTPLPFERGLPHDTSSECGKDGHLLPHREQPPAVASTPSPAVTPNGAPFKLTGGGK